MKKIFFFIALIPALCISQVEIKKTEDKSFKVGEIKPMGVFIASFSGTPSSVGQDTAYVLCFKNNEYTNIVDVKCVSFYSNKKGVAELYDAFKSPFSPENKKDKNFGLTIKLGRDNVSLSYDMKCVKMRLDGGAYCLLSEKQVDKLFGKK